MRKLWLIARHEYQITVRRRAFLAGTLGIPLLIVLIIGMSILVSVGGEDQRPVGYIDLSGILEQAAAPAGEDSVEVRPFADEASARQALAQGTIQAFYVLPTDYLATGRARLYEWDEAIDRKAREAFKTLLRDRLATQAPPAAQRWAEAGLEVTLRSVDGSREFSEANFINLLVPFVAGILLVVSTMTSIGYLLQAVTAEKENRTIEILTTTVSSLQLMAGKALGLMAVAMTQLLIWVPVAGVGLAVGAQFVPEFRTLQVPWDFLLVVLFYFLPSYALIAATIIAIGGVVSELSQAQQIAGILNLFFLFPYFFLALAFSDPNSPLMVGMTLFPTTAFITVTIRWGFTVIPFAQMAVGWLLLVASAVLMVWASARIFRAGMLRYGQRLSLQAILAAVRGRTI